MTRTVKSGCMMSLMTSGMLEIYEQQIEVNYTLRRTGSITTCLLYGQHGIGVRRANRVPSASVSLLFSYLYSESLLFLIL